MADNPLINDVRVLTDEISTRDGVSLSPPSQAQEVKLGWGADGVFNTFDLSTIATQVTQAAVLAKLGSGVLHKDPAPVTIFNLASGTNTVTLPGVANKIARVSAIAVTYAPGPPSTTQICTIFDGLGNGTPIWKLNTFGFIEDFSPALASSVGNGITVSISGVSGLTSYISIAGYYE